MCCSKESFRRNHTVNVLQNSYSMLIYANFINFCPPEDQQASVLAFQTADISQRNMSDHALPYEMPNSCDVSALQQHAHPSYQTHLLMYFNTTRSYTRTPTRHSRSYVKIWQIKNPSPQDSLTTRPKLPTPSQRDPTVITKDILCLLTHQFV